MMTSSAVAAVVGALVLLMAAPAGHAQVFLSSSPHPDFAVAPLFVSVSIDKTPAPAHLTIFWSLTRSASSAQAPPEHLLLLVPFAIAESGKRGESAPDLAAFVQTRGFSIERQGAVPLVARNRAEMGTGKPAQPIAAAPYVTFFRESPARGRGRSASLLRIPWSSHLASPDWLVGLDMTVAELVRKKPTSWYEDIFWGPRYVASVSFGDLRNTALYPLYFEQRDHVVAIGRDFSMLSINFADADHLRIDQLTPATANRQASESRRNTETISVPIQGGEGIAPQVVRVNYTYFTGRFEWRPIVISLLFLIIGNITGPILMPLVRRLWRGLTTRVHVGAEPARQRGVIVDGATLGRLRPGESTYDDVVRLFGADYEEHRQQQLAGDARRTLRYRGQRLVPYRSWHVGRFAHVRRWDLEMHEVDVELHDDRVADVQARVRRAKWAPTQSA